MFSDLDWPLNASQGFPASAELLVTFIAILCYVCVWVYECGVWCVFRRSSMSFTAVLVRPWCVCGCMSVWCGVCSGEAAWASLQYRWDPGVCCCWLQVADIERRVDCQWSRVCCMLMIQSLLLSSLVSRLVLVVAWASLTYTTTRHSFHGQLLGRPKQPVPEKKEGKR